MSKSKGPYEIEPRALYTVEEVALWLRISEVSVRRWIKRGVLKGVKYGNAWRFLGKDLLKFASGDAYDLYLMASIFPRANDHLAGDVEAALQRVNGSGDDED